MTTIPALISVEEFLNTSYKPNCEYLEGVLRPKAMGTTKHGQMQVFIAALLMQKGFIVAVELTVPISPNRFLVPDVAVANQPIASPYPDSPVHLCIEILSPGDRVLATLAKCEDYHAWGVPYCWVIDPEAPRAWECHRHSAPELRADSLRAGDIEIGMAQFYEAEKR